MKKITLSQEVLNAIFNWYNNEKLTYDQIGKIIGINKSSVCAMLSGRTATMSADAFALLLPYIQKYLPSGYKPLENSGAMILNNGGTNYGNAISGHCLSVVLKKINASNKLSPEEKVKVTNILLDD